MVRSHFCIVPAFAALGLMVGVTPALALDAGNIIVRGGIGYVGPNDDSDASTVLGPGNKVTVEDDYTPAVTIAYMVTPSIGVEFVGSLPFNHDIKLNDTKIADTDVLPPTLLAQYYFNSKGSVRPYVGAGINYTAFFSTDETTALAGAKLDLDNSWGLAAEAGIDIDIGNNWLVNASVWYMDIDTDATVGGTTELDVEIDPWVGFIGVGYRF